MYGRGFVTADEFHPELYRPRRRLLARDENLVAVLRYYDSSVVQPLHAHERTQVSFLLLGSIHERQGGRDYAPTPGSVGVKPAGCMHADRFGGDGALILTIETDRGPLRARAGWSIDDDSKGRAALIKLAMDVGGSTLAVEAMLDLLDSAGPGAGDCAAAAPAALQRARERLHEQPEDCRIDALAASTGFERTHFAQLFRRHFGLPPSIYRAKRMTVKATRALLSESRTIADAAFAAGFADHSHFTKSLRRFTGLSPRQLRAALS